MLQLDASAPPLWRSPTALQLGDEPRAVIDPVQPWQERVIQALIAGVPDGLFETIARQAGAPADEVAGLRELLEPALARPGRMPARIDVSFADEIGDADRAAVRAAFSAAGAVLGAAQPAGSSAVVVLVASRLVEPRRAAALVAADAPHLGIELSGDRVTVGPLVVPGTTGCLACLHQHRRDQDAAWPALAAQLLARPCPPTDPALIAEACATALRIVSAPAVERTRSMTLRTGAVEPTWRDHEPHPACWCRSPGRSATPAARSAPTPVPTRSSGYAQPA